MADYNPEEAAKLKHLGSLAQQTAAAIHTLDANNQPPTLPTAGSTDSYVTTAKYFDHAGGHSFLISGVKTKLSGGYDVTITKYTYCPAVLVETAFIDNPNDAKLLVDREYDFARGISDYYVNDKPLPDVIDTHKSPERFS